RWSLLHERPDAFTHVLALRDQCLGERLLGEARLEVGLERAVEQPLREAECERGAAGEALGPLARGLLQVAGGDDLVGEPEAGGAAAPVAARDPERSAPVQKALPAPVSTTARTSGSSPARASASRNAWRISAFIAFRASGRLRTIHATPFSMRQRSVSPMLSSPA